MKKRLPERLRNYVIRREHTTRFFTRRPQDLATLAFLTRYASYLLRYSQESGILIFVYLNIKTKIRRIKNASVTRACSAPCVLAHRLVVDETFLEVYVPKSVKSLTQFFLCANSNFLKTRYVVI